MVTGKSKSFELIDESVKLQPNELKLFIEVEDAKLRFALLDADADTLIAVAQETVHPLKSIQEIPPLLEQHKVVSRDFNAVNIALKSKKQCLVPLGFYLEGEEQTLFQKVHGTRPETLGVFDCTEAKAKIIFERNIELEKVLLEMYPNAQFFLSEGLFIESLTHRNRFVQNPKLYIDIEEEYSHFYLFSKSGLLFSNRFDTQSDEDILYHASNIAKQYEIEFKDLEVHFSGAWKINAPGVKLFKSYAQYVNVNMGIEYVKLAKALSPLRKQHLMTLLNLVSCAS
ncbi:MAG: DUF3822 family protein [Flavobacteriales bacterium]|nr:DUF3822 family protein [Flavobacteriales bacterium]MDG1766682.1 DUF3822 family protein [Flavobacteriales bacterium]